MIQNLILEISTTDVWLKLGPYKDIYTLIPYGFEFGQKQLLDK